MTEEDGTPKFAMHRSTRDDYFAWLLAQPSPMGLGDRVRYDHSTALWHIWNGVRWAPDRTTEVFELIRQRLMVWLDNHDLVPDADAAKVFSVLFDAGKKVNVLKMLASMPGIAMTGEEWDKQPNMIGFNNGVLDLTTLTLDRNPDPGLLISRSTGFDWDDNADPKPFLDFITDVMSGDPDMVDYLLRVLGYCSLGTNREQKFWMWVGGGSNGKGVLARTVAKALGDYAATPPDTLYMRTRMGTASSDKPRPELLKLQGVRFTYMSEPQGGQFNEELLKAHSGNDFIEARTLYSQRFKTFLPTHKIVFLTNNPPRTEDVGPSMQRRVRIIWFLEDYRDPSRNDPGIEERLQDPKVLQGALRLLASGAHDYLNMGRLVEPTKVEDWSKAYILENDPVEAFLRDSCVQGPGNEVPSNQLFKAFEAWTERNGYDKPTLTGFGLAMKQKTSWAEKKVRNTGNVWAGIRLKNITDHDEESSNGE